MRQKGRLCSFFNFRRWTKCRNPTILRAIINCLNPFEITCAKYKVCLKIVRTNIFKSKKCSYQKFVILQHTLLFQIYTLICKFVQLLYPFQEGFFLTAVQLPCNRFCYFCLGLEMPTFQGKSRFGEETRIHHATCTGPASLESFFTIAL